MPERRFWVYIMGGAGQTIYIGVTNNLMRRVYEHKTGASRGFTSKYNLHKLLYYTEFGNPDQAIAYEKQLKGWVRRKKDALIEEFNPDWRDLAADWFAPSTGDSSVAEAPSE